MVEISKSWPIRKPVNGYKHFCEDSESVLGLVEFGHFTGQKDVKTVIREQNPQRSMIMACDPLFDCIFWEDWSQTSHYNLGAKMANTLILYRICMPCLWIDWYFSSEFNGVHIEVILGHIRGQKGHFGVKNR